jgi:glycerol-3-phosphate cytidylyltransferase
MDKKYKVGLTFMAADPPHIGHKNLLKNAKKLCDKLIVCISDADYIKKHKNREEFLELETRKKLISMIKYVDEVDVQSLKFRKKEAIAKYKADVLFVGDDWTPKTYTGMNLGVEVVFLPRTEGISSSVLRESMKK